MSSNSLPSKPFHEYTAEVWQRRSERSLSNEDLRQIQENITGFINVLQEWSKNEKKSA